jgi:4-hydroxy-3-polyprenylbenzoate decarboxylase
MILVVGITGATGVIYGIRLLDVLSTMPDIETHLIISEAGEAAIKYETDWRVEDIKKMAAYTYNINDMAVPLSSGSFKTDGMVIMPCTIKTMSALANSYCDNLIVRAGDVILKERRKLVLSVRETPLHLGHLRAMERLTEMGAVIMPPVPAFYHKPKSMRDILDHTVGKILDIFGIYHDLFKRWSGVASEDDAAVSRYMEI